MPNIIRIVMVILLLSLVIYACGPGEIAKPTPTFLPKSTIEKPTRVGWEAEWEELLKAARQEGKLLVYSTPSVDVMGALGKAFYAKCGIKVEYVVGRGEELARRMLAEQAAGIYVADVVISGGATGLVTMKPQGLLDKLEPLILLPEVKDPKMWRTGKVPFVDKDGYHIAMIAGAQRYMLRNTDLVKEGELKSYKDLLNPKWKGKMTSNDPTIAGTASAMYTFFAYDVWGLPDTLEYMRQMVKQEPVISRDNRLPVEWVAKGKYSIGIATPTEQTSEFITLGAPIAMVKAIEGVKFGAGSGGLQIPKIRANPNAARVFVNWLLTKEGQTIFARGFGHPSARLDASTEGIPSLLFPEPDEKTYPDTEETVLARSTMMNHAREIFAPLVK